MVNILHVFGSWGTMRNFMYQETSFTQQTIVSGKTHKIRPSDEVTISFVVVTCADDLVKLAGLTCDVVHYHYNAPEEVVEYINSRVTEWRSCS